MFGNNQSVITSSTIPESPISKRHMALAYHRIQEAIASGILAFIYTPSPLNIADILSKNCRHQQAWPHLKPLLFWRGDTKDCDVPLKTPKHTDDKSV